MDYTDVLEEPNELLAKGYDETNFEVQDCLDYLDAHV